MECTKSSLDFTSEPHGLLFGVCILISANELIQVVPIKFYFYLHYNNNQNLLIWLQICKYVILVDIIK